MDWKTAPKLPPSFYLRDTVTVAKDLLGKYLVTVSEEGVTVCQITETEAYAGPEDPACHSSRGNPKGRTNVMYDPGGKSYVYLIYGMYCCFNVTTCPKGDPQAVLIRSAQPVEGIDLMCRRRGRDDNLCTGPGKLCIAMGISRDDYGQELWGERIYLLQAPPVAPQRIAATSRINVDYAGEAAQWPYRFVIKDSPYLSVKLKKTK